MKDTVICIGRQYGSGGREVGTLLAKRLGIPCYDKLLINQAARESGLAVSAVEDGDEKPLGFSEMVSGNPFADSVALTEAFYSEKQRVFDAERRVITEAAKNGPRVIIGRCASSILRDGGMNVLSVFIYADTDDRTRRIAERNGIDIKAALRKAEKTDRMRKRYFEFYSDTPWGEAPSYDIMVSSSRYGIEGTADLLARAVADETNRKSEKEA